MNPFVSLLLIALGAVGVILVLALGCSVLFLAMGKRYSVKQFNMLKDRLSQLLGDEILAESILEGAEVPPECENREQVMAIVEDYRAQQERIREVSRQQQEKRARKRQILKFLTEKKDKLL